MVPGYSDSTNPVVVIIVRVSGSNITPTNAQPRSPELSAHMQQVIAAAHERFRADVARIAAIGKLFSAPTSRFGRGAPGPAPAVVEREQRPQAPSKASRALLWRARALRLA